MRSQTFSKLFKDRLYRPVFNHTLAGVLIGYFVFHPLTMVVYFFQAHHHTLSFAHLFNETTKQVIMSLTIHMQPMGVLFSIAGGVMGFVYGCHSHTILKKNKMLEEREKTLKTQILVIEKQASLGIMSSSIGHEISNILVGIFEYTTRLQLDKNLTLKFQEDLQYLLKFSTDLRKLSKALLTLGRPHPDEMERINIHGILTKITDTLRVCGLFKGIRITKKYSDKDIYVRCNPFKIEQAIRDIEINASHVMKRRGELILETGVYPETRSVYIKIKDTGKGIKEEHLEKIFEPFFTTKKSSQGTGLGLSITKQIIEEAGGKISAGNRPGGGAEFEIVLPSAV